MLRTVPAAPYAPQSLRFVWAPGTAAPLRCGDTAGLAAPLPEERARSEGSRPREPRLPRESRWPRGAGSGRSGWPPQGLSPGSAAREAAGSAGGRAVPLWGGPARLGILQRRASGPRRGELSSAVRQPRPQRVPAQGTPQQHRQGSHGNSPGGRCRDLHSPTGRRRSCCGAGQLLPATSGGGAGRCRGAAAFPQGRGLVERCSSRSSGRRTAGRAARR